MTYPKAFRALIVGLISFQMVSCGTLIYPERRGQKAGRLDVGIVLLDTIGLLFFLIPGIIAFAIDFSTGAIYLPAGSAKADGKYRIVRFDPKKTSKAELEKIISQETGNNFHFDDQNVQYMPAKNSEEISLRLMQFEVDRRVELSLLSNRLNS